ncbi:MAG: hypothetical protein GX801_07950 [Fibrobacter sp.]|nr:hypothetical protein [Fibrobacter sp.]
MQDKTIIQKFAHHYIEFAARNKRILLLVIASVLISAIYIVNTQLKINTDLASLLPRDTPSVLALEESNERFGSTDKFMIAIQSDDPVTVAKIQEEIQQELLQNWTDILVSATIDNENKFFQDHALLYLPIPHLERIRDNLEDIQYEIGRSNLPFVIDLLGDVEEEKTERIWFDASIPQELGLPDEAADVFSDFFASQNPDAVQDEWNPKQNLPSQYKTRLIGQLSPPRTAFNGVVQCKLTKPSTDIDFAELVTMRADTLLQKFRQKQYEAPFRLSIEGTYESLKEVEDLKSDSAISLVISVILIFFLVVWFFSPSPPKASFSVAYLREFF